MEEMKAKADYQNMNYKELLNIIISGCKFMYVSYDHKKALEEYRNDPKFSHVSNFDKNPQCWYMPESLKEKYRVEKIGKLREITFNPSGIPKKIKIGNKFSKSFGLCDFGVNVFPIIENK